MCAIAGMIGLPFDETATDAMLATMRCRGPDAEGKFITNNCCMLHRRLSVIDPAGGHQPMSLTWAGETYTIVYNGELYNTDEIRKLLEKLGHSFKGHSDTEVILHAYVQWSEGCLDKFNGIFAFAVWENRNAKLFLARDRMGVKPLFYSVKNNALLFASEIKTLLKHPSVSAQLDAQGAAQIILIGPGRIPGSGVFKGIQELEPGCFGYFHCGRWSWKRYWKLTDREHTESFEQTAEYTRYLVTDAIKRQMVSDVPIGAFLSGGLDSSLICAVCQKEMEKNSKQLKTFSVDYENNDKYFVPGKFQPNSDNSYIAIMQQHLNTDHHWTVIKARQLVDALYEATQARDLPGMADVDISLLILCGEIRRSVKVALSGECADEIFGGYPWYRDPAVRAVDGFPWAQNTQYRASFLTDPITKQIDPVDYVNDHYRQTIDQSDILPGTNEDDRRIKQMVNLNHRWFMQTLLDRKDRMSMHHGLEVRVPFCDYRIAEYLYGVPWHMKDHNGREKGLLRYAMSDWLPDPVINRRKSPYPKTYDPYYLQLVSDMLKQLLKDNYAPIYQIIKKEALQSLLTAQYTWPWYGQLMKVPQTIAYMLQINHWMIHYNISVI